MRQSSRQSSTHEDYRDEGYRGEGEGHMLHRLGSHLGELQLSHAWEPRIPEPCMKPITLQTPSCPPYSQHAQNLTLMHLLSARPAPFVCEALSTHRLRNVVVGRRRRTNGAIHAVWCLQRGVRAVWWAGFFHATAPSHGWFLAEETMRAGLCLRPAMRGDDGRWPCCRNGIK